MAKDGATDGRTTVKLTVTVPHDVAARVEREGNGNMSAFVTSAIRDLMGREQVADVLARRGGPAVDPDRVDQMRTRVHQLQKERDAA